MLVSCAYPCLRSAIDRGVAWYALRLLRPCGGTYARHDLPVGPQDALESCSSVYVFESIAANIKNPRAMGRR
jgi:hypothetical protein